MVNLSYFQALTKELESRAALKVSVVGAGAQLLELMEAEGDREAQVPPSSEPDLCSVSSGLRQAELDWTRLQDAVPALQQALHQVSAGFRNY